MPDEKDPRAVEIMVPSTDPEKEEDLTPKHDKGKQRVEEKDEPEIVSILAGALGRELRITFVSSLLTRTVRGGPSAEDRA